MEANPKNNIMTYHQNNIRYFLSSHNNNDNYLMHTWNLEERGGDFLIFPDLAQIRKQGEMRLFTTLFTMLNELL